jgi:hypothetical protein
VYATLLPRRPLFQFAGLSVQSRPGQIRATGLFDHAPTMAISKWVCLLRGEGRSNPANDPLLIERRSTLRSEQPGGGVEA